MVDVFVRFKNCISLLVREKYEDVVGGLLVSAISLFIQ